MSITPPDQRPDLSVRAAVEDSSGDGVLEAGEKATLRVKVTNEGEGPARSVEVWAAPNRQVSGVRFGGDPARSDTGAVRLGSVDVLAPSASKAITGRLLATKRVSGQAATYFIRLREKRGFAPEAPTTVAVKTKAYRPPALKMKGIEIAGGTGRRKILPGRISAVRLQVRNAGPNPARDLTASVQVGPGGTLQEVPKRELGTLAPGASKAIPVSLSASKAGGTVPVRVSLKSTEGPYATTLKTTVPVATPVDRLVPKTDMSRPNAIAVVIGIEDYQNPAVPDVKYALEDARVMKKYLTRAMGFREENIIFEKNATGSALERLFGTAGTPKGQLYNYVRPDSSSAVFVYYSGHGAPAPGENQAYLVASNTNPNYLSLSGYPVGQLYENLSQVPAKSVTVVLEACFSGVSQGGAVVQRASPVELSVENPVLAMKNGLAFTAGAADQMASWYSSKEHGLFTYFFLKGLRGAADRNGDRVVTGGELGQYVKSKVPYRARRMYNREQTPQVVGPAKDRVLVRYGPSETQN
ncbi:MAG: caspase family protein [Salinibacter sp.]